MLEAERIAIYPIDARGLTVVFGMAAMAVAAQQMREDAAATGGTAYVNTNGLALASTAHSGNGRELLHADLFAERPEGRRKVASGGGEAGSRGLSAELSARVFR